jgi:serine/threonine protein phosphatase PrpC
MEDRHVVQRDVGGIAGAHVVAVFDGHRGFECAEFAKNRFVDALVARFARRVQDEDASETNAEPSEDAPAAALREAFLDVHAAFCAAHERASASADADADATARRRFPGCAATAALVWGDYLYVANAGDCRAVLCRDDRDAADAAMVAMSEDHSAATNAAERARIESVAGAGAIRRVGGDEDAAAYRVGPAGLAVTRALGDADCSEYGVTAEPEVRRVRLTPRDAYVVVACDGLWDVVSASEVGAMLRDTVKEPSMCAKRLGSEALTRMSGDNITVIVAFLKDVDSAETVTWERSFRSALT